MKAATRRLLPLVLPLALGACGGGVWFGFGDGFDDIPPSISLTSNVTTVAAGGPVTLIAAAADENGVEEVRFYRDDGGTANLLCSDGSEPFQCVTNAPNDGRTALVVFARATDTEGNTSQSSAISIVITPP